MAELDRLDDQYVCLLGCIQESMITFAFLSPAGDERCMTHGAEMAKIPILGPSVCTTGALIFGARGSFPSKYGYNFAFGTKSHIGFPIPRDLFSRGVGLGSIRLALLGPQTALSHIVQDGS